MLITPCPTGGQTPVWGLLYTQCPLRWPTSLEHSWEQCGNLRSSCFFGSCLCIHTDAWLLRKWLKFEVLKICKDINHYFQTCRDMQLIHGNMFVWLVKRAERACVPLRAVSSHPTAWPLNSWGGWRRTARGSQDRNVICHSTWHDTDMTCHMTWQDIWHSMLDLGEHRPGGTSGTPLEETEVPGENPWRHA